MDVRFIRSKNQKGNCCDYTKGIDSKCFNQMSGVYFHELSKKRPIIVNNIQLQFSKSTPDCDVVKHGKTIAHVRAQWYIISCSISVITTIKFKWTRAVTNT